MTEYQMTMTPEYAQAVGDVLLRRHREEAEAPYVVVEGGLVQYDSGVTVINLDFMKDDPWNIYTLEYADETLARMKSVGLTDNGDYLRVERYIADVSAEIGASLHHTDCDYYQSFLQDEAAQTYGIEDDRVERYGCSVDCANADDLSDFHWVPKAEAVEA